MISITLYKDHLIDYNPRRKGYIVYFGKHRFDFIFESIEQAKLAIDKGL